MDHNHVKAYFILLYCFKVQTLCTHTKAILPVQYVMLNRFNTLGNMIGWYALQGCITCNDAHAATMHDHSGQARCPDAF